MAERPNNPELPYSNMAHILRVTSISLLVVRVILAVISTSVDMGTKAGGIFLILFFFRYLKLIVNTASWCLARPYPQPAHPKYRPEDATVIIPTANPKGSEFRDTVESALRSGAAKVIIVTFGAQNMDLAQSTCSGLQDFHRVLILDNVIGNKRSQMCRGVSEVKTPIVVFCDDHVFWPRGFLGSILAPFEDPLMGGVGMHKRVHRVRHSFSKPNFTNFLGCVYLDRHNMEILATNRLDGGVFIISSRTAAYRTEILMDPHFQNSFRNEYIHTLLGRIGPLNADDDNFIMRWLVTNDWKIWIQNGPEALMETTINNPWSTFKQQLLRWIRTTWRSNPRSLWEGKVIYTQPWSLYATYISLFVNFALVWDPLLLYSLHCAVLDHPHHNRAMALMAFWIVISKLVKLIPHLLRNPMDFLLLPGYFLFAYYHSLIKLWALFTFWNISWGSRKNVDEVVNKAVTISPSKKDN